MGVVSAKRLRSEGNATVITDTYDRRVRRADYLEVLEWGWANPVLEGWIQAGFSALPGGTFSTMGSGTPGEA